MNVGSGGEGWNPEGRERSSPERQFPVFCAQHVIRTDERNKFSFETHSLCRISEKHLSQQQGGKRHSFVFGNESPAASLSALAQWQEDRSLSPWRQNYV